MVDSTIEFVKAAVGRKRRQGQMVPRVVEQAVAQSAVRTAVSALTGERVWERERKTAEVGHVAPALGAAACPERALVLDVDARRPGCVGRDWKAAEGEPIELAEGEEADPFESSAHEDRHLTVHEPCVHACSTQTQSAVFEAAP